MKRYRFLGVLLLAIFFMGCNGAMGNNKELNKQQEYEARISILKGNVSDAPADDDLKGKNYKAEQVGVSFFLFNFTDTKTDFYIEFNKNKRSCRLWFRVGPDMNSQTFAEYQVNQDTVTFDFTKFYTAMSTLTYEDIEKGMKENTELTEQEIQERLNNLKKANFIETITSKAKTYLKTQNPVTGKISNDKKTITLTGRFLCTFYSEVETENTTFTLVE